MFSMLQALVGYFIPIIFILQKFRRAEPVTYLAFLITSDWILNHLFGLIYENFRTGALIYFDEP
jgi:hypothetical protein